MNKITITLEVPKDIPDWFKHISDPLPDGFIEDTTGKHYFGHVISEVSHKRILWGNEHAHECKNTSNIEIDKLMSRCPIEKESESQKIENEKIIYQWYEKNKISRYIQWHKYYIETFLR